MKKEKEIIKGRKNEKKKEWKKERKTNIHSFLRMVGGWVGTTAGLRDCLAQSSKSKFTD